MVIADDGSARFTAETDKDKVAVLEWRAWDGFLLTHVLNNHAVRIETDPFHEFPEAEFDRICNSFPIVCFQINLSARSRLPLRIRDLTDRFQDRGLHVVNGLIEDFRKSRLQAHLEGIGLPSLKATPSGPPEEVLFVKTDLNYGGELERWLPQESIAAGGLEHLVSADIGAYRYHTASRATLQESLWTDPAIVIERFVSNPENSFYRVYFSGKQIIIVKAFAPGTIKKLSNDARDTNFLADSESLKAGKDHPELSAALKRDVATFVEQTPVEFGCVDIVHDGHDHHYIIDLNLTPYAGARPYDAFLTTFLKEGIISPPRRKVNGCVNSLLSKG